MNDPTTTPNPGAAREDVLAWQESRRALRAAMKKAFFEACRGYAAYQVAWAMNRLAPENDFRRSTKGDIADTWVREICLDRRYHTDSASAAVSRVTLEQLAAQLQKETL